MAICAFVKFNARAKTDFLKFSKKNFGSNIKCT